MVARDHLADQPKREELHADHQQQDAEHQQRPVPDRMAERFQNGQVDEDRRPEHAEDQPEPTEQMQRAVAVAADERDRQQIEEAAQVTLHPVTRAAVFARAVVDRQLGDAEAAVVGQHRDEAVQLAVEAQAVDDFGSVRLQPAVHVVQLDAGERARDAVEDA